MVRFSIVVPAYNAAATLPETLDSMLSQDFFDWECIVVDDGSTDATQSIAQGYCDRDERFRLIRQENRGTAGAYTTGLAAAVADLLVICAADDFLLPEHLKDMDVFTRANPEYEIYSSNGEYLFQESGVRRKVYLEREWRQERSMAFEQVVARCFYSVGVVFRRQILEWTGGHRLGVYVDDYDLWLRAMLRGARHRYTPRVLSVHRVSDFQQSANLVKVLESNIAVFGYLLANMSVSPVQQAAIEASIANNEAMIRDYSVVLILERQAQNLRIALQGLVGARHVDLAVRAVHSVSWIIRPFRRIAARWRPK